MSELQPMATEGWPAWEATGSWQGGTAVAVAMARGAAGVYRLIGAPSGLYAWCDDAAAAPVLQGVVDPNIVAVALCGTADRLVALAATASGRLLQAPVPEFAWAEVGTWAGLGVATVLTPAPDFVERGVLFVGTPAGIFRTLDHGQSWESCNFGLLDEDVLCLACAPNYADSELLWAGTAGGGLYRSRNGGRAWREAGIGLPDAAVQALAVSPNFAHDRTLYVGLEDQGVYRSVDGGEAWQPWAAAGVSVNALACSAAGGLWAGTQAGVYAIAPDGTVASRLPQELVVLALAAGAAGELLVATYGDGVYDSSDGGETWRRSVAALHAPPLVIGTRRGERALEVALDNDGVIALCEADGAEWQPLPPASEMGVFGIAAPAQAGPGKGDPAHGDFALFAATGTGLVRWAEGVWGAVGAETFGERTPLAVDVSPHYAQDQSVLVVMHDDKLLLSADAGVSWQDVTGPWADQTILRAQFGPAGGALLVLTVLPTPSGHFEVAVWQSADAGQSWVGRATLTSGLPAVLVAWPADPLEQAIFLATQHRLIKLFYPREDAPNDRPGDGNGETARELQVQQAFFAEATRLTALHPDPTYATSGQVWVATTAGVMHSVDRGETWAQVGGLPQGLPLVRLHADGAGLRAVALGGSTWRVRL
jgi:hypothetical protein